MPSTYPAALDDLTPGNTDLDHGDVSDAVAAVQATLGVNPQGAAATVAARLDGPNLDLLDQGPTDPDPPAAGYTRLVAYTNEGNDTAPFLAVVNSEGFDAEILSVEQAGLQFIGAGIMGGFGPGSLLVRGLDPLAILPPGTDGQVLTADSSADVGLAYTDPHIITSPLGVEYRIVVDEAGALTTEAV